MPVNIHGKSYNTVAERIVSAGKDLIGVSTEVLSHDPVVIKAIVVTTKGEFSGISAANPKKTMESESPYEVAETSAVGRALAFAGYETTNGIASAEEVNKAISSPLNAPKTVSKSSTESLICDKHNVEVHMQISSKNNRPYFRCTAVKGEEHFINAKPSYSDEDIY